jgi:hypothetical protein
MYSDEFGVLRFAENNTQKNQYKHSPILNNSELSISNQVIGNQNNENLNFTNNISLFASKTFVHSYYVSRYFTLQSSLVSEYFGIGSSVPVRNPDSLNIKVVDDFGNKYIDEFGNNNYEIYLDGYTSSASIEQSNLLFYRIIILLPDVSPNNLNIIYDKFEISNSGIGKNQFLGFKEKINSVPIYKKVEEESEVIDFSSSQKKIYSTKLFSHKENTLLKNKINDFGWKAFVPKKSIQDVRTFQSFNWRLVAKIVYNFSNVKNIYSDDSRPTVRCAVLTENNSSPMYPYVFNNAEEYPYNIQNFIFENPLSESQDKNSKNYWTIDIADQRIISSNYDILYWCPTQPITETQSLTILDLLNRGCSVFIDTSFVNSLGQNSGINNLGISFNYKSVSTGLIKLREEYINGSSTFNGWNMQEFNEDSGVSFFGITGRRKNVLNQNLVPVRVFDTSAVYESIEGLTIARIENDALIIKKNYGSQAEVSPQSSSLYLSSYNISSYINDSYGTSGVAAVANRSATNLISPNQTQFNPIIEGGFKLFYNVISESIRNKVVSSRIINSDSSVSWHVSPWRNSWTINGERNSGVVTVLSDQEKSSFNFSDKTEITASTNTQGAETKFVRQIFVNNNSSISDIFYNDFQQSSKQDAGLINRDYSNVEFYIECTNQNVEFLNFEEVDTSDYIYGQQKTYKVFRLTPAAKSQIVSLSPVTLDAHSRVVSPEIDFNSINYPYMLVDESEYRSEINDNVKIPSVYLPGLQNCKDYSFDLGIQYSRRSVIEINSDYSVNWEVPFSTRVSGNGSFTRLVPNTVKGPAVSTSIAQLPDNPIILNNPGSPFNGYGYSSKIYSLIDIFSSKLDTTKNVKNNFHFTNDIAKSQRSDEYKLQSPQISSDYVKYIQYTLNQNGSKLVVDGKYGPLTKSAVTSFQQSKGLSFIDGIVDSETKAALATYWINLKRTNTNEFQSKRKSAPDNDIKDYINRSIQYSDISNVGVGSEEYRRISFTGTAGPTSIVDDIIVRVPDTAEKLNSIVFTSGAWNTKIKKIWLYDTGLVSGSFSSGVGTAVYSQDINQNVPANQSRTIQLADRTNIKYIKIRLEGDKVPNLGPYAEGFSIKNIVFNLFTQDTTTGVDETNSGSFSGVASGKIKGTTRINDGQDEIIDIKKSIPILSSLSYINEIYFDDIYVDTETVADYELPGGRIKIPDYSSSNPFYVKSSNGLINNSTISYSSGGVSFTLRPQDSTAVAIPAKPTVTSATKLSVPASSELISKFDIVEVTGSALDGIFSFSSKISQEFEESYIEETINIDDFFIRDADDATKQIRRLPRTINASDGLVVLCNQDLTPVGFPDFSQSETVPGNTAISFGYINLVWTSQSAIPYGLRWEFYNIQTRKFYGRKISYYDYINDGPNNIYVGLLAYDNDGDSATDNIYGEDSFQIEVSTLPSKIIAPLYSVKTLPRNKISVKSPPNKLSKFDPWFVEVSSGKFYKNVNIPQTNYTNFLNKHKNSTLRCLYDTTTVSSSASNIFGSGYYDVKEENPIIISDNEIQLRHGSFHVYQNQINKVSEGIFTDANPIIPAVNIKIKDINSGNWKKIDIDEILSFNKNSGSIVFKKEIVPSNSREICVDYTVKNANILLRHINGQEIPLNPFLSPSSYDKPIYLYIVPTYVEYIENGIYLQEQEYTYNSAVQWTNDYGVFNINKETYNPLAIHIGTITVNNSYSFNDLSFKDLRVKGGGLSGTVSASKESVENKNILSFADIYSGKGYLYPNGGYIIVRIPKEVKSHFTSEEEIYSIVRSNLTAGVSFDIQDLEGNDWRTV